nr:coiled-coil domain-containing protein 80-like [Procambarus clarkii]
MSELDASRALQMLQHLGLDRGGSLPTVTQGHKLRQGDSPIYYIKLPPLPYYYVNNNNIQQPAYTTTSFPFQKVDLNFTNNGRPTQIYHWGQSTSNPDFWKPSLPSTTTTTTTTTTPPPTTTTTTIAPTTTTTTRPTKKPWLTLNKYFPYNGRPSNVYIWKPRPPVAVHKYKHPYFKHFNY